MLLERIRVPINIELSRNLNTEGINPKLVSQRLKTGGRW